jgi:CRISPR-associated protein Cas1
MATSDSRDYFPARMLNEVTYCPRLFWYEYVEGLFVESADTVDGKQKHASTDEPSVRRAPTAARERRKKSAATANIDDQIIHKTSVTLSSERFGIIAKIDLLETGPDGDVPIEYKRGRAPRIPTKDPLPPEGAPTGDAPGDELPEPAPQAWDADLVQLAAQVLCLEDDGRTVPYGIISYLGSRLRVRVAVDDPLRQRALDAVAKAKDILEKDEIPAPLVDDPRCVRCSLLAVCLPEETARLRDVEFPSLPESADAEADESGTDPADPPIRRIVAARDDLGTLYVNTQGARVGKSGEVLVVTMKDEKIGQVPLGSLRQINLYGNIQMSTQAMQQALSSPSACFRCAAISTASLKDCRSKTSCCD